MGQLSPFSSRYFSIIRSASATPLTTAGNMYLLTSVRNALSSSSPSQLFFIIAAVTIASALLGGTSLIRTASEAAIVEMLVTSLPKDCSPLILVPPPGSQLERQPRDRLDDAVWVRVIPPAGVRLAQD